jgi:putative ABC transport system permease protein
MTISRWHDDIRQRLSAANLDPGREAEIAQELAQHLDDRYEELRAMGYSDDAARRAALDELSDDRRMREELVRVVTRPPLLEPPGVPSRGSTLSTVWHDVRYAARMLRRSPAFALVSVMTLTVGIGGTVAIFSAVYTVLYRPLPLAESAQLAVPVSENPGRGSLRSSIPYADYAEWREQRDVFEQVALFEPFAVDIGGGEAPERVPALEVTEEYFPVMRVQPLAGRLLTTADHDAKSADVVVISDALWRRRFGADPAIAGKPLRLSGRSVTIVGVAPAARLWPENRDVWLPLRPALLDDDTKMRRDNMVYLSIARVRPQVPFAQAQVRLAAIGERVAREHPESRKGWETNLIPLRDYVVEPEIRLGMFVLLGGAGLVLLIACVNLANLLLARGADRAREMALRSALGASRSRLVRQMLTESLVVAVAGGIGGLLIARWLVQGLKVAAAVNLPMLQTLKIDGTAAIAAASITVATAVLFGLLPALAASAFRPADALREGGRSSGVGRRTGRLRDGLVVAQIALAIVLLAGAGLMLRSFIHLTHVDPGVDVDRLLIGRLALPGARYPRPVRAQWFERLTDALASAPGVERAAASSYVPAGGGGYGLGRAFLLEGQPEPPATQDHNALWNVVSPEYFRTTGIRVVRGRAFDRTDSAESRPVMIINETMARKVFGTGDPIGRRIRSWRDENVLREIVGVVSDVRYTGLASSETSLVYVPHRQDSWGLMIVSVRAKGRPASLAATLREEVRKLDADVAVAGITTLESLAAESIAPQRFGALLLAVFAGAALLLAGVGVYGVMNYVVSQRRHEMGIRLALGASPRAVFARVVLRGLALAAAGAALGMAGALLLGPVIGSLLSGVAASDGLTLTVVPFVIAVIALLACALPARRAAHIAPLDAIRRQ